MDNLIKEAQSIQDYLDTEIQSDNVEEIKERGDRLASLISRTGNMIADAKRLYKNKLKDDSFEFISKIITAENKISSKVQNTFLDSLCAEEGQLFDKIEQLNKTAKYQIEWCRSRLSLAKEEMSNTKGWNK